MFFVGLVDHEIWYNEQKNIFNLLILKRHQIYKLKDLQTAGFFLNHKKMVPLNHTTFTVYVCIPKIYAK